MLARHGEALGTPGEPEANVFPSARTGGMLGHKTLEPKTWCAPYTVHGFRTSLTTWAQEQDDGRAYPQPVILAAIAHNTQENESDASYLRSNLFEARRDQPAVNAFCGRARVHGDAWR